MKNADMQEISQKNDWKCHSQRCVINHMSQKNYSATDRHTWAAGCLEAQISNYLLSVVMFSSFCHEGLCSYLWIFSLLQICQPAKKIKCTLLPNMVFLSLYFSLWLCLGEILYTCFCVELDAFAKRVNIGMHLLLAVFAWGSFQ
ncbi:hypothetical protein KP509_37G055500 [Ceratopteris richardii]|uniref:Uncharacterized protein n=1 Tax=Ceratopteris richardii TaxID=49495 RepID=A0A8T2Q9H6_CERRI|nr:hypothetical protein KP509_37G055500 [Ceratopteris richardii]